MIHAAPTLHFLVPTMAPTLFKSVDDALQVFLTKHHETYTPEDVYRAFVTQATLEAETMRVRERLRADPFECLADGVSGLDHLIEQLRVMECYRSMHKNGSVQIDAVVVVDKVELTFQFDRSSTPQGSTMVDYSIAWSLDSGPKLPLLWIQVLAEGNGPSVQKAINVDSDSDGEPRNNKRPRISKDESDKQPDQYHAGMDADNLQSFLTAAKLQPVDDVTAAFLLLTFPFFEHEWDLVGFVLDAVFGQEDDTDDESNA